jgi:hypothetical protein
MQTERTDFRPDDVATAHRLLALHQPYTDTKGITRCGSASHATSRRGPQWPCLRAAWIQRALAADEAGHVTETAERDDEARA